MIQSAKLFAKKTRNTLVEIISYFIAIDGTLKAGSLAYITLISIVPFMVLSFSFLVAFPTFADYFKILHRFLFRHLVPSSASTIQRYVESFAVNAHNLSATSLIIFLSTTVVLIFSMETVFNSIWKVKTRRKGLPAFLMYWAILTLLPPLGVFAFAITIFLYSFPFLSSLINVVAVFIPFIVSWVGYLFLYMTVPNGKVHFKHAATGSLVASGFFESTKALFHIYATHFSSDTMVYGVLAAIPVFLLWLYICWLITIFGGVISYIYSLHDNKHKKRPLL